MVGVAGGIRDEVKLGDVVVATQVLYCEQAKQHTDGINQRPQIYPVDPTLLDRAKNYNQSDWHGLILAKNPVSREETIPAVIFGPIAAGEKVIADSAVLDQLRKIANNALTKFLSFNPVIQDLKPRILDGKKSKEKLEKEFSEQQLREKMLRGQLEEIRKEISRFDMSQLDVARSQHDDANKKHQSIKIKLDYCKIQKKI